MKGGAGKSRRVIIIVVIALLVVAAEAGALYKMVGMVIRGESPRQLQAQEESHTAEAVKEPKEPEVEEQNPVDTSEEFQAAAEDWQEPPAASQPVSNKRQEPSGEQLSGSGDIGEYYIEIGGIELAADTEGQPSVVVTYTWTNNSTATASAMVMLLDRASQGETELTPTLLQRDGYDPLSSAKNVSPGGKATVQRAFRLANQEERLTFSVTEFLSHTRRAVVKEFDLS